MTLGLQHRFDDRYRTRRDIGPSFSDGRFVKGSGRSAERCGHHRSSVRRTDARLHRRATTPVPQSVPPANRPPGTMPPSRCRTATLSLSPGPGWNSTSVSPGSRRLLREAVLRAFVLPPARMNMKPAPTHRVGLQPALREVGPPRFPALALPPASVTGLPQLDTLGTAWISCPFYVRARLRLRPTNLTFEIGIPIGSRSVISRSTRFAIPIRILRRQGYSATREVDLLVEMRGPQEILAHLDVSLWSGNPLSASDGVLLRPHR